MVSSIESTLEYRMLQVQDVYQALLHRPADALGLSGSTAFLAAGGTVEQLDALVATSPEYLQVRGGGTFDGFLDAVYQDALARSIDAASRSLLDQAAAGGLSRDAVAGFVFSSLEYQAHLVNRLYVTLLNRPPDPGGLQNAVTALQLGLPDEQLIALVAASNEYYALP